jgi:hypothetical protein
MLTAVSSATAVEAEARRRLRVHLDKNGLSLSDVVPLLRDAGKITRERQTLELRRLLEGDNKTRDVPALRAIAERVEELLDVPLMSDSLQTTRQRIAGRLADVVGVVLGIFSFYLVVGGLLSGESRLLSRPGVAALLAFAGLVAVLALFEAMHTSGTLIQRANLDSLSEKYPRLLAAHRRIRTPSGVTRFLAGRQVVVVVTVFFTAALTSFPDMDTWPFTSLSLPGFVHGLVVLGIPGALVLLWVGQLSPQFVATRQTLWLMNRPEASLAIRVAHALDGIGVTRGGSWFIRRVPHSAEKVPSAPADRWDHIAEDEVGYATVGICRHLRIDADGVSLLTQSNTAIRAKHLATVTGQSLLIGGGAHDLRILSEVVDVADDELEIGEVFPAADGQADRAADGWRFRRSLHPRIGTFAPGTDVRTRLTATFDSTLNRDWVYLDAATRFLVWHLEFDATAAHIASPIVTSYVLGEGFNDRTQVSDPVPLELEVTQGGLVVASYALEFPIPHRLYEVTWEVTW